MEIIRQYVSALFARLPATLEILHLKDAVLDEAQRDYDALLQQGVGEHEAVGRVLDSMGTLDDLCTRHGVQTPEPVPPIETSAEPTEPPEPTLLPDEVEDYLDAQYRVARMNALGVALCICGPACPILFDWIPLLRRILGDGFGAAGLFICVAAAVMLFIHAGSLQKDWRGFPQTVRLTEGMRQELRCRAEDAHAQRTTSIALGVGLCVLSPAAPLLFGDGFGPAMLFAFVALGVYLMILSGVHGASCRRLLKNS